MDLQLAYRTVHIAAWNNTSVVAVLRSMLSLMPLHMQHGTASQLKAQPFTVHTFLALVALN